MNTTQYLGKYLNDRCLTIAYQKEDTFHLLLDLDDAIELLQKAGIIHAIEKGTSFSTSYVKAFAENGRRRPRVGLDELLRNLNENDCMRLVWYHERLKELHQKGYQQMLAETFEEMRLTRLVLAKNRKALGL